MSEYNKTTNQSPRVVGELDSIPSTLKHPRQWVRWRMEDRNGKLTKIPLNPKTGHPASTTDPSTWGTFEEATKSRFGSGLGFVFTRETEIVGIDLDHVITDGVIDLWAQEIIREMNSYTELSPSLTGIHIYFSGILPEKGRRKGQFECYSHARFFTVTGKHLPDTPLKIEPRSEAFLSVHERIFGQKENDSHNKHLPSSGANLSDEDIIEKASRAVNGEKFRRLWQGNWEGSYPSQSEADAALCSILAFYLGNAPERIDRLFRLSGLMRPKWDARHYGDGHTYGEGTVSCILAHATESSNSEASNTISKPYLNASDGDLSRLTTAAWGVLHALNQPPQFFRNGNALVRLERDSTDRPIFRELTVDRVIYHLGECACWYKITKKERTLSWPPIAVAKNLLATPDPPLPVVNRITEAPFFAPDLSLQSTPGYCPEAKTFFSPPAGFNKPRIPMHPTAEDIYRANQLLQVDLLGDFPFVDTSDRTHALALLLLPFVRSLIQGPTPLHLIEKPTPGTGATLIVECLFCPAVCSQIAAMSEGRDEDEWRKRITAKLITGPSVVFIDNLRRRLDSAALSSAITTTQWEDRLLGRSETVRLQVACAWVATGNNPSLSNEMVRRSIRIRLDAKIDRPWLRKEFRHPNLRDWANNNRSHLVWAALILIQNWIAAGHPNAKSSSPLGMFESWSQVMGGILECAGISGFLANLSDFYEKADAEGDMFRQFVRSWWQRHGGAEVAVSELWGLVSSGDFALQIGDGNEKSQRTRLGILLSRSRDRQFDRLRITEGGGRQGAKTWKLIESDRR
jgi:hypothetical protein